MSIGTESSQHSLVAFLLRAVLFSSSASSVLKLGRGWSVGGDGATLGGVISLSEMSAALDQLESELLAFEDHPD